MKYWQPYGITDPDASYINGDPTIGRRGSIPPAEGFEQPQREIVAMIEASGLTPTEADTTQLFQGTRSQVVNYAIASNTALGQENAVVVRFDPPLGDTMTPGMPLRIKAAQSVSGPATLTVDDIQHPLRRANGAELENLDIVSAETFEVLWNDTFWAMTNFKGPGGSGGGTTNNNTFLTKIPYAVDIGTSGAVVANFSPAITVLAAGDAIEVKLGNDIPGATTLVVNGLTARSVVRPNGSALQQGDGVTGQIMLLIYRDDNKFQFEGIIPQSFTGLGIPVGGLILTLGNIAIPGTLKLNGALLNRVDHPNLWNFANTTGRIVEETDWVNATSRAWTAFSRGNGTTTFRLPELRGEFLRMYDDARGIDPARLYTIQQGDGVGPITATGDLKLNNPFASVTNPYAIVYTFPTPTEFAMNFNSLSREGQTPQPGDFTNTLMAFIDSSTGYTGNTSIPGQGSKINAVSAYIRGNAEFHLTGGASETRPRNANVLPCVVDG